MSNAKPRFDLSTSFGRESLAAYNREELIEGRPVIVEQVRPRRSNDQNSLSFAVYTQISEQSDDQTIVDIRRHCKLDFGIPVLCEAKAEYAGIYHATVGQLDYERQLLCMDWYKVTSEMSKAVFSYYMDEVIRAYTQLGYALADPRQQ